MKANEMESIPKIESIPQMAPHLNNRSPRNSPYFYPHLLKTNKRKNYALLANVLMIAHQFYAIMALELSIKPQYGVHSHDKFMREFEEYRNEFNSKVAEMFHEYIALICLGEMRHGANHSDFEIEVDDFHCQGRNDIWLGWRNWTIESILRMAKDFFNEFKNPWEQGYGGYKWHLIAEGGLKYGHISNEMFIDHCFDLQHNNCYIFDKEGYALYLPSKYELQCFLDFKRNLENPSELLIYAQTYELQEFISRAANLGMLKMDAIPNFVNEYCPHELYFKDSNYHVKIKWASHTSSYINHFYSDDNRDVYNLCNLYIDELMRMYHPWQWGDKDMTMEKVLSSGRNFTNGEEPYQEYDSDEYL